MDTTRTVIPPDRRTAETRNERLSEAWQAFVRGAASKEDADLIMADLASVTGYFFVSEPGATGDALLRNEGRRDVMARILFLLDLPFSYMTELRRAASDEHQLDLVEGEVL